MKAKTKAVLHVMTILLAVGLILYFFSQAIIASSEEKDRLDAIKYAPKEMPVAWCVNVCQEDIFNDMHNKGDSWGAGSSSMNGMSQNNVFETVIAHCTKIYSEGCLKISYWGNGDYMHKGGNSTTRSMPLNYNKQPVSDYDKDAAQ